MENLTYNFIIKSINDELNLSNYQLDENLIKSMFYSTEKINEISFFNIQHLENNIKFKNKKVIKYNCINQKYIKNETDGVIGIYYESNNMNKYESYYFKQYIDNKIYILIIFISLFCIVLYKSIREYKEIISIVFLYIINLYIIYYTFIKTSRLNSKSLQLKFNDINTSTLSIAFLISINIFIINYVKVNQKTVKHTHILCIILFSLSIIYLLASLYKITAYNNQYDIRKILITKQLLYNLVIIINSTIIILYLLHFIKF
jgi:hypothetical protein